VGWDELYPASCDDLALSTAFARAGTNLGRVWLGFGRFWAMTWHGDEPGEGVGLVLPGFGR